VPAFGHLDQAQLDDPAGPQADDVALLEADGAGKGPDQAGQHGVEGGLADPV
jgi:hypothetical protein